MLRRCARVLALAVPVMLASPSSAQGPVAYITEIRGGKGDVLVQPAGTAEARSPQPLLGLKAGDQITVTGQGRVTVLYHGGGTVTLTAPATPYIVQSAPRAGGRRTEMTAALTGFFFGKQAPPEFRGAATRGTPPPTIVSPRHTRLVAGEPVFEWEGCTGRACAIRVLEGSRTLWEQRELRTEAVSYPSGAPPLRPGVRYAWEIQAPGEPTQRTEFEVMSAPDVARVREALGAIDRLAQSGYPPATITVMRAGVLVEEGLYADARRELEASEARNPADATVPYILAHVYEHVGLTSRARDALRRARERQP